MTFDIRIFSMVFFGMLIGHGIGEFIRAAYRRWKANNDTTLPGAHYFPK